MLPESPYSEAEIATMAALLRISGTVTTIEMIGNGIHDSELDKVKQDPAHTCGN